jgi:hypothetical protein
MGTGTGPHGLGPTRRSGRWAAVNSPRAADIPPPHGYRTSTATVKYATNAPELRKPSQAAAQRSTSACATAAHRRCRHDAASSMQAGDAEAQGAARPTGVHCMCRANGHTLHATGNMQDRTHVETVIKSRIRPQAEPRPTFVCAGEGAGEAAGSSGSAPVAQRTRALRSVSCSGPPRRAISQHLRSALRTVRT